MYTTYVSLVFPQGVQEGKSEWKGNITLILSLLHVHCCLESDTLKVFCQCLQHSLI